MCHVSCVTCHVSGVRCHVSYVKCPFLFLLFLFFYGQSVGASWWRVCYQRGLPRLVHRHFHQYHITEETRLSGFVLIYPAIQIGTLGCDHRLAASPSIPRSSTPGMMTASSTALVGPTDSIQKLDQLLELEAWNIRATLTTGDEPTVRQRF